jgi:protocadherin Fat 1/2/3
MATDGVHQTFSWVYVTILDINDNSPQFGQSTYSVEISESVPPGTDIFTVSATDADEDKRVFYTIHSAASPASLSKFSINSETGDSD